MFGDDKIEAFAAWLRARGTELTKADRAVIAGFVAVAGARPVAPTHIAQGLEMARSVALPDDGHLERLGALLLAFEAEPAAASEPPPAEPPAAGEPPVLAPPPAPPAVAPLQISIRSTTQLPNLAAAGESATEPSDEPARDEASEPPRTPRRHIRRWLVAGGAVAAAAAAAVVLRPRDEPPAPVAAPPPAPPRVEPAPRLRRLALGVRLPDGWREASDAELGAAAAQRDTTELLRGATPSDPDHGIYLAAAAASSDLIATARAAERGVIRQLGIAASAYHPGGCSLVALGAARAARCRGIAERGSDGIAVEIFVRGVGARTIVALSLARPSQAGAAAEAAAIVGSLTP